MGSKNKLKRFKENESFPNVIQPTREEVLNGLFPHKGKWSEVFGNENPLIVELGCGKGEYTVELARMHPENNYIGIDIKGARLWRGAKTALEDSLENVHFIRSQIGLIDALFAEGELSEIWITFPDPQIKYKRTKHRLTNLEFLKKYARVLKKQGIVHLKTDSEFMHGYTLGILQAAKMDILYSNHDVYKNEGSPKEVLEIQTFYENQYLELGKPITYLKFRMSAL
ncbi:tRNA (guanosine(46)-N7)-methyltransferase TrmB [Muriicola soli]|uniref:tRNA (guanine-N(7)-)-methyltransferase n=1 Tax=Muriicola soli TaxID=2507538 RepID=A0A411EBI2_9FLAO|nr:tRNA (guanosine(46)-N7)-methyltransferase TrmB [Muriicola soli]QBA65092.1 tRNA (guanosine(46)-N7)-methyltransferase TrmB [Muriicola soli]